MIEGTYVQIRELAGIYGIRVNGSIKAGDIVTIRRNNDTVHRQTVAEVIRQDTNVRFCSIVPVTSDRLKEVYFG